MYYFFLFWGGQLRGYVGVVHGPVCGVVNGLSSQWGPGTRNQCFRATHFLVVHLFSNYVMSSRFLLSN